MTPLGDILIRRIATNGPITLADYMVECLFHPEFGYYATRDPFGQSGDFTTAPEISQMFGELIGLALAQAWIDQGRPDPFTLCELGPGRGTLMADILRATTPVAGFHKAAQVHLVEASPTLRAMQRQALGEISVVWHRDVAGLPDAPLFLVANEFFDALPIRQFVRHSAGWCEVQIGEKDADLVFGQSQPAPLADLDHRLDDTKLGDIVETCAPARPIIGEIDRRIAEHGGVGLIFDYGGWQSKGDTFQALKSHEMVDPLAYPGQSDLTAHVDFAALSSSASSTLFTEMTPQGVVLERLGITNRAQILAKNLEGDALVSHIAAHRRLTHPDEMGSLFKAIAMYHTGAPPPPGFGP